MQRETRNTIQRSLILAAVREMKSHPTAEDVYIWVLKKHKGISKATVYSNLKLLAELGEIQKIDIPNQSTRYDHTLLNHYHLRCRVCGNVFDSAIPYDENFIKHFQQMDGFRIEDFSLILNGTCPDCINK